MSLIYVTLGINYVSFCATFHTRLSMHLPERRAMPSIHYCTTLIRLQHLRRRWWRQLGTKYSIPESARNAKAVLVVHEVMLKVIFLQLPIVRWEAITKGQYSSRITMLMWENLLLVMEKVVGHVVTYVSKDSATVSTGCRIPIIEENSMCEFPERKCEYQEERGWHYESKSIHW